MANAKPGERYTYYVGFLARGIDTDGRPLAEAERKMSVLVAQAAWSAAMRGLVHLLQRRLGESCFEYFAVSRRQAGHPDSPAPS
jgi:hypothetical protein